MKKVSRFILTTLFLGFAHPSYSAEAKIVAWSHMLKDIAQLDYQATLDGKKLPVLTLSEQGINQFSNMAEADGIITVVWIQQTADQIRNVAYARIDWTENTVIEQGIIPTVNANAYSPNLVADDKGTFWAAWVEEDDSLLGNDDIYYSYFEKGSWFKPQAVLATANNPNPDGAPVFGRDGDNNFFLWWLRMDANATQALVRLSGTTLNTENRPELANPLELKKGTGTTQFLNASDNRLLAHRLPLASLDSVLNFSELTIEGTTP